MSELKLKSQWVDITEITENYLPVSKRKARKFVQTYLHAKRIGKNLYVSRDELEAVLNNDTQISYPLEQ